MMNFLLMLACRPREKIHRPQTRRRRDNNEDSYQRLQTISDNIRMALQLFELVVKRERKKRDMTYVVTDWQQLQIKQKHNPRAEQETVSFFGSFALILLLPKNFLNMQFQNSVMIKYDLFFTPLSLQIEQEYQTAAKSKNMRRPVGFEKLPEAAPAATNALLDFRNKKNKKRCVNGFKHLSVIYLIVVD